MHCLTIMHITMTCYTELMFSSNIFFNEFKTFVCYCDHHIDYHLKYLEL